MRRGKTVYLTDEQRKPLIEQAYAIVNDRYERLWALSDAELLELRRTDEELELGGIKMSLLTHIPHPEHPAFGVLIYTNSVRLWRWFFAPTWTLAQRAFWFRDGKRAPFADEDYRS